MTGQCEPCQLWNNQTARPPPRGRASRKETNGEKETLIVRQIPPDLKRKFKVKCAEKGISLQAAAIELMRRWVEEK